MPMPRSVTRVRRNGVEFTSNVDRAKYTIQELSRAALKDVAKLIRKRMIEKAKKMPGLKRNKRIYNSFQYWVRRQEGDLVVGVKHDTWYSTQQELGTSKQPKRSIIRDTVYDNIDQIRIIQGQYLSAIENENRALGLIDEGEEVGNDAGN